MPATESTNDESVLSFDRPSEDTLLVRLTGEWKLANKLPVADEVMKQVDAGPEIRRITFDTEGLRGWDSGLLIFLIKLQELASQGRTVAVDREGLSPGIKRLLSLATAVPERKGARREEAKISILEKLGNSATASWKSILQTLEFIGEATVAFMRLFSGKARFRPSDFFLIMQECGAQALPIVSLISILVGLILAFIGAIQLKIFGAQIYVASLVGIGMVRALAAIMTGIIMAGRTGAAFAAQLGTMQVNEEIDALKTLGIAPMEFLVLPRMLALFIMMPLLSLYADLMGILGGLVIGVSMLNLNFMEYYIKTQESVSMTDFLVGLFSAAVFGVLVALAGCKQGMQCGRSASAVGEATTSAVVTSIVSIVVAMALITVVCNVLNI
jgi:phospholipid/cholesterol/gamma-HCH transport system permease protein